MRQGFPVALPGMVVGLLGGSFDPAHVGHVRITEEALKRFGLDRVWWLVSPGNPLKPRPPAPLAQRLAEARRLMRHPKVVVTGLEARLGTRATFETLRALRRCYPGVRFVWLMGADNLAQFHRWGRWREIMGMVPVGVLARPGAGEERLSPAARAYGFARLRGGAAALLGRCAPPVWCFVNLPLSEASSTAIRAAGGWRSGDKPRGGAEIAAVKPDAAV